MNSNPDRLPNTAAAVQSNSINPVVSFWLLLSIFAMTLLLAWVDAIQEGVPGTSFMAGVVLRSVAAQLPGLVCGVFYLKVQSKNAVTFLIPAFAVALVSVSVYVLYVSAGRTQTTGQMHVVFVPMALCILAILFYSMTALVVVMHTIWSSIKKS